MSNHFFTARRFRSSALIFHWVMAVLVIIPMEVMAAPVAVDDIVLVPSNTAISANDLAANDTNLPTDTYTITTPPSHGTATLSANGLLDYTPNVGFASFDTLTYTVDDGAGGIDTATVTFEVVLTSDFLTPASNFIIGQEDIPTPLNLSVDPSLEFGGTLQDIIGVDALYRDENGSGTAVASTIPSGSTGINITGYATRNVGTNQNDVQNDDYELLSVSVDLREGTYSGRLTYSILPNLNNGTIDQYTWLNVPLGQSVLTDTSFVEGLWTGAADLLIEIVAGQVQITETIPLQIAYHIEYMTSDGDSTDFVGGSGDLQNPGEFVSTFVIPAALVPTDGSKHGYLVLTGNSAANGSNFAEEHKGFSRLVIDLQADTVSGVIASERGELDSRVTTWAFLNYPLIDLRDTPAAVPVAITDSTATRVGDDTASVTGIEDDPTIFIDASGDLIVERESDHAAAFTTMYTSENYRRTGLSSIASFVGVESDTTLFDSNPPDGVDSNGKPINIQTFAVPASSSIGIVQMSWQTIAGSANNENVGYGFAVIDLNNNTSAGSITFSRTTTPDLVAWQSVPLGTTMFGATDGGIPLFQSNKAAGAFTDDYAETARFTLVDNADGTRTLEFTASSNAGTGAFADYIGTTQVSWLGSEPFSVDGLPATGLFSHGAPTDNGDWEVDFADIPLLTLSAGDHATGELELEMLLSSTGELDTVVIHVEPVVDDPTLTANDAVGYLATATDLGISVIDSADIDGSETQIQTLTLAGVPTTVTLASGTGTVSDFGGGNWQVDRAALAGLTATGTAATVATITVSGTNTDTDDLDGDTVIEDTNNGAGVDELDTAIYQETFDLIIREVPTVTSQLANTGTPVISGTANTSADETLSVTVNGITYIAGDGNLVDNGDGTWDLIIPSANTIADGSYSVTATLTNLTGATGTDITVDELIIDSSPPAVPAVIPLSTSDATPVLSGTATVAAGETLTVTVDGITYTAGDGNLVDNANGTWTLSITTPLAEATYEVTAAVTDAAGNSTTDITVNELIVQAIPLSTPTVVPLTTSNTTPTITGAAVIGPGDTLTVTVAGVTYTAGDGNLTYNSSGIWSLNIPSALPDNTYEVVATVTDVFGNAFPDTSSDELIVDTTAPATPTVISQTTNNTTPTISGSATVNLGETLRVMVDGVSYTEGDGNLVINADGTWDLTLPAPLAEGTYSVVATITDAAGNIATDTTDDELIIDITAPAIPTVTFQTTSNTTPVVSGTATVDPGETLSVSVAGITYTAGDGNLLDNGDGTWDLNIPAALADGNYSVTAIITDESGNSSEDTTALELTIDTTAPVTPTVAAQSTNTTSPTITGTATVVPGDTLTVTVDGVTYTAGDGNLTDNGDGTWVLSLPVPLAEGTFDVIATVTDPAGNATSDNTIGELIIDLTAPIAPGVTSLATTDTTPVIEGTATVQAGETLSVEVDGIIYTAGDGNLVDNGDGTWNLTIPATNILAENLYQVIARVTDAAGNSAVDPGVDDLLVDLTAPLTPGVTSLTTNDTTPVIEGTAVVQPGETLTVTVNGINYTAGDGNLVDNGDGTWSLSIPTPTTEGLYDVTATLIDSAGNSSTDPSSSELLIDTTLPLTPTATPLYTSNTSPVISGTANPGPGETLTVTVDGTTYTVGDGNLVENGDGTWDLTFPATLAEATYEVTVSITDAAGNVSTDTSTDELVIDITAPPVPTIIAQITNITTPVISGTSSTAPGETLTVTVNGVSYTEGNANLLVNPDGTWELTIPTGNALADGTYEVIATVTDLAGNSATDTTATELIVDTIPPPVPTVVSQNTSNTTPVISGTATIAPGETLTVTVDGVVYTAGDGNLVDNGDGTWNLTLPVPLADNSYPVTVTVIDSAGNATEDVTTAELIIDTTAPAIPTVVAQVTSNTSPTVNGTAVTGAGEILSVTLNGFNYTTASGDLIHNSDGTWQLTVPVVLADSVYEVIATVTDLAGNSADDITALELTVDTTPPVVPTVMFLTTNNSTPVLSGTATVNTTETLTVLLNGTTYTAGDGFLTDNGAGTWDLSVATALADGSYNVTATVTDAAGNASTDATALELTIDTVAPAIPTVTSQITNSTSPVIAGTATVAPGDTLTVTVDGVIYTDGDGSLLDNGDGTWSLTTPVALPEGTHEVIATVTDPAGNATDDATAGELIIDITAPIAPGVTSLATTDTTPVIEGTATIQPGEVLTVEVNGVIYTAGDGDLTDNGDGTWTLNIPAANAMAENLYQVIATVTDAAGNSALDPGIDDLLIDLTAPVTPGVTSLTTNNTTPVLEGTAVVGAGEILSVTVNGVTYTAGDGNLTDNADGTWMLAITATINEGLYDVTATITDTAGNISTDPSSSELLIDTTAPQTPTVTPLHTNNTSPVISGTANAGPGEVLTVVVDLVTYTSGDGNLLDNGDGTWDLSIPTTLAEATYEVIATVTDAAGNVSTDTSADELVVDITAPLAPTVNTLTTNNTTPVISGTASTVPGETLTVTVNGVTYTDGDGNLTVNADGTWSLVIPAANALADGSYEVIATTTDLAGNATSDTTAAELIVDTNPPVVPTVVAQNTNNSMPVISGTAVVSAGETLTVTIDGITYTAGDGNLVDNGDGTWDLTLPVALADNTYTVTVTILDSAGNVSEDNTTAELVIDTVAPVIPTVTAQTTNNTTPVITGTATVAAGETLSVTVDNMTYTAGDGNLINNGDGTWTLSVPVALAEATYEVVATVTDIAGNTTSDVTAGELTIDTTAPVIPTVISQATSDTTPVVSGTAIVLAGETLSVTIDGVTYTAGDGNLIDNGDGTWDLTLPIALPDNTYAVTATITDVAGNTSDDTTTAELVIDTIAPVVPTVTAQTTNNASPSITGTATVAPGETLSVTVDGVTYSAGDGNLVDNGDGTWALAIPLPLAEGAYDITVTVTDPAGNIASDATSSELIIDITAPVPPGVTSLVTTNTTPVIEGTATVSANEILTVEVDGITYTAGDGNLVDNGDGTWALTIPAGNALAENLFQVTAMVTDAAGNSSSDPGIDDLLVDLTAPVAPGVTSLTTNDTTPIIEGTAIVGSGETLSVTVNGITYIAGDGNLIDNGDGTWTLSIPTPTAEGLYDVTATVTDIAGNNSTDPSSSELLIDTTPPQTPTVAPLHTNNTSPIVSGTANAGPGEVLTVEADGVTYTSGDGNLVDNGDGTWNLSIPVTLAEASYEVIASVIDAAGNVSTDTSANELVVDLTTPIVPTVTTLTTSNTTPEISGTTSTIPGETLTVTVNGVTYTASNPGLVINTDGTWVLTIPAADALPDNTYEVIATITDLAGNSTTDTTASELTVDTNPPVVPTVESQITNNTTPVISGTATLAPGETLTVTIDGVTYTAGDGNLIDNGDGTWDLTLPTTLADSTYPVTVTVIDAAGNSSVDVTTTELVIDTDAPVTPVVTSQITNNTTPVIEGSATVPPGETLSVTVDGVIYNASDGNLIVNNDGTWTLNIPTPLAQGSYDVVATITDAAGNTSSDTSTAELIIDTTAPDVPVVEPQITNDTTPVISGTANIASGETLSVTVDGITYTAGDGSLIDNGDGTWTLSIPTPLLENSYNVITTVTDLAGNSINDNTTGELVIDLTAPTAPGVTNLVTADTSPVIEGTADLQANEVLTVEINGVIYTDGDGNLLTNSDGTWLLTIPSTNSLPENLYEVIATVTDAAGNSSIDPGINDLLIDITAPAAPGVTSLTTNDTTPTIEGTATLAAGEIFSVTVNGTAYTAGDGNLVNNGDGSWTLSIPTPISEGLYDVTATITDIAGNISTDPGSTELLIDTTAPTIPTVIPQVTSNTTPVISGSANAGPGELLTVTVNGVTYTAGDGNLVSNSDGSWELSIPTELVEGTYDVVVTVTDAAGNVSTDTSSDQLIVDTTTPASPTVNTLTTNNTTPVISGTATLDPGEILTVTVDGILYTVGDGNLIINSDGTWTLNIPTTLTEGIYDVTASITDSAGNTTNDSGTSELIIDTSAPIPPTAESLTTTDSTPTLTGSADIAANDTLTVTVNGTVYTAGGGNLVVNSDGTWSLNIPFALPEGIYQIEVTVTDPVGNTSVGSPATLTIQPVLLTDSDNDGVPDAIDLDDDNDGIPDLIEGQLDTDGDGIPDNRDLDSDNDGIADIIEVIGEDNNNDYRIDDFIDQDNNGLSDELQLFPLELVDTDSDLIADFKDLDSDNDGLTDLIESGGIDDDNNGRIDKFTDNNNDGADDQTQVTDPTGRDTDADGIVNRLDLDSDNDGIFDIVESGAIDQSDDGIVDSMQDTDLDGIPDSVDSDITGGEDTDGDSIDDRFDASITGESDTDSDGIINSADPDANGDGLTEVLSNNLTIGEALPDINGNGTEDLLEPANALIRTGLQGHGGCSAYLPVSSDGRPQLDPLLIILATLSGVFLRRRYKKATCTAPRRLT